MKLRPIDDSINMYLGQIQNVQLRDDGGKVRYLSFEEEKRLAEIMAGGGPEAIKARNTLVETHLNLVVDIAKRFQNRGLELDELIEVGNLALVVAAKNFKIEKGNKFSTYAESCIEGNLKTATGKRNKNNREAPSSLENPLGNDQDNGEFKDNLVDDDSPDGSNLTERKDDKLCLKCDIEGVLRMLPLREREIIRLRYMHSNGRMPPRRIVGKVMGGLTGERIRNLEDRAMEMLRSPEIKELLEKHL